ncbi:Uu.00g135410.m01.CDS01 [Anthostomella pinea]|uniref:Uu.00g135410.m01.CDS01 n=1 Tax=Anthostomella pinea TaxID=933095 RepID=A0AAI8VP36_9PEZI|nr:Uu.00g135410.m01.CDS01 [Anthostomella pinea]
MAWQRAQPGRGEYPAYMHHFYDGSLFPPCRPQQEISDPSVDLLCIMCDERGRIQCQSCHAPYCSDTCRAKDRSEHAKLCDSFATEFTNSNRPTGCIRALLFPARGINPKLVWVRNEGPMGTLFNAASVLAHDLGTPDIDWHPVARNINGCIPFRRAGHGVRSLGWNHLAIESLNVNESVLRLGRPWFSFVQYGPILFEGYSRVVSEDDLSRQDLRSEDITPRDFRSIVDFFLDMMPNPCISNLERFPWSSRNCLPRQAVKINCDGDLERFHSFVNGPLFPRYEEAWVPSSSMNSPRWTVTSIQHLGLHWVCQQCLTNLDFFNLDMSGLKNEQGNIFQEWSLRRLNRLFLAEGMELIGVGSVLVMYENGAPINRFHVAAVVDYMKVADRAGLLGESPGEDAGNYASSTPGREREQFERFWTQWLGRVSDHHDVGGVHHPTHWNGILSPSWSRPVPIASILYISTISVFLLITMPLGPCASNGIIG